MSGLRKSQISNLRSKTQIANRNSKLEIRKSRFENPSLVQEADRPIANHQSQINNGDYSVLRWTLEAAAPTAWAARPDLRRHELAVDIFPHGKDAVADLEVFQGDGLTFFGEGGLVIDHDDSFALAPTHLDLVPLNGKNLAAGAVARHAPAWAHASAGTSWPTTWPAATLKSLKLFRRDPIDPHGHYLLVSVGSPTHHDVVPDFQILQLDFLRLLLPRLPLAEVGLTVHHHGLRGAIRPLDLEAIDSHGRDRAHHRRRTTHAWPGRYLTRGWRILLCGQRTRKTQNQKRQNAE